jgi:hypothetical protein
VFEREHREHFEELTLLQTRGNKLCLAIIGPPWVGNHLSEGMRIATLHHTKMARELAVLRAVVSSAMQPLEVAHRWSHPTLEPPAFPSLLLPPRWGLARVGRRPLRASWLWHVEPCPLLLCQLWPRRSLRGELGTRLWIHLLRDGSV